MTDKKGREEIETLLEVCEIYEYCDRGAFEEKNIGGETVIMCRKCARVLPKGIKIENLN